MNKELAELGAEHVEEALCENILEKRGVISLCIEVDDETPAKLPFSYLEGTSGYSNPTSNNYV